MTEQRGVIVEHYRLDVSRPMRRALAPAALAILVGSIAMAVSFSRGDPKLRVRPSDAMFRGGQVTVDGTPIERPPPWWPILFGASGLACIIGGGASAIVRLRRVLIEETYLALRSDGAVFACGGRETFVSWDEIEDVEWDGGAVRFVRHDGSAWLRAERYAGIDGAQLARRAAEIRRKALFGTLELHGAS